MYAWWRSIAVSPQNVRACSLPSWPMAIILDLKDTGRWPSVLGLEAEYFLSCCFAATQVEGLGAQHTVAIEQGLRLLHQREFSCRIALLWYLFDRPAEVHKFERAVHPDVGKLKVNEQRPNAQQLLARATGASEGRNGESFENQETPTVMRPLLMLRLTKIGEDFLWQEQQRHLLLD
eukprot:scaffold109260_cov60-Phaeocystis_antarctica.AAC.3